MKNIEFRIEDFFGDVPEKKSIPTEQLTKIKIFLAKWMGILFLV